MDIKVILTALISVDLMIIYLKFYIKLHFREDKISWKLIGILQVPILIFLCLFFTVSWWHSLYLIALVAMFICSALGIYLGYKGKKSATEPVEAEIIDINTVTMNDKKNSITIYTLTLKYNVNGVEYINKNTQGYTKLDENIVIGNKIMIKYNPKNPNDICS